MVNYLQLLKMPHFHPKNILLTNNEASQSTYPTAKTLIIVVMKFDFSMGNCRNG